MKAIENKNHSHQSSSLLAPSATRKLNLKTNKVELMTSMGKTTWNATKIKENLTQKSEAKLRLATVSIETMVGRSVKATYLYARDARVCWEKMWTKE